MSYCVSGLKTSTMINLNSKPSIHDNVIPLTITTDMSPLSLSDNDCSIQSGIFNPIVGKSSDFGYNHSDIVFNRMKSVDSAVCSMFTPSSSLQMSPSSQIGSNYGIYDSTSSSNNNNDSGPINDVSVRDESHLKVPLNQSKSRFLLEYDSQASPTTNNTCHIQSNVTTLAQNDSTMTSFDQNHSSGSNIMNTDSVALSGVSQNYRDYNIDYSLPENTMPLHSGYIMNKMGPTVDNVLLWQNQNFRYETTEKDERINVGNNWLFEDSGNFGNFNTMSALNQILANSSCKRPITGGHSVNQQSVAYNQYIRPQHVPWNCYGTSTNTSNPMPIGITTSSSSGQSNPKSSSNSQPSNNPWNQALVNQKLGLAPSPVNAMNLSSYPPKLSTIVNGKKQLSQRNMGHSSQNNVTILNSGNNVSNSLKSSSNKTPVFDMTSTNQNASLTAAGDGYLYDTAANSNLNYLEKIASNDNLKINFDPQLFDVLRSLETKAATLSIDDNEHYSNNLYKNMNPLLFPSLSLREERFSRKVFVGGLPPDIDEEEITAAFKRFGTLVVDWPHKAESKSYFPPKGYCFLLFQEEISVQNLIESCIMDENKYYWCVSSPTIKDKPVQIRPWSLADSDFVMDGSEPLDPRKTIFVGGVPRPLRAVELAMIMDRLYGGVCYSGIDTDPELKYPKGAGRVAFSNQQSYIAAISARFVQLQHHEIDKRVEVKPYVLDDQMCDECQGSRCGGKFAPFFCANVTCLQYYCEQCWAQIHSRQGREYHKPLVKEGADRPRTVPFRW